MKVCNFCGKPLPKYRRKFCSDDCQIKNFELNIAPYWWSNATRLALEKADNKCDECGSIVNLQVHHKDPLKGEARHNNKKNQLDNLIVLCKDCHLKEHRSVNTKRRFCILKEQGQLL